MADEENDEAAAQAVIVDPKRTEQTLEDPEFRRMFAGEMDAANCFVDIQAAPRHRSARLGRDAVAHAPALGRTP